MLLYLGLSFGAKSMAREDFPAVEDEGVVVHAGIDIVGEIAVSIEIGIEGCRLRVRGGVRSCSMKCEMGWAAEGTWVEVSMC